MNVSDEEAYKHAQIGKHARAETKQHYAETTATESRHANTQCILLDTIPMLPCTLAKDLFVPKNENILQAWDNIAVTSR